MYNFGGSVFFQNQKKMVNFSLENDIVEGMGLASTIVEKFFWLQSS